MQNLSKFLTVVLNYGSGQTGPFLRHNVQLPGLTQCQNFINTNWNEKM